MKNLNLSKVKTDLEFSTKQSGFVKIVENTFFTFKQNPCILRDFVYNKIIKHNVDFEILAVDKQNFVGSKEHAEKLLHAYGGRVYPAECNYLAVNAKALYVWELPYNSAKKDGELYNPHPLDCDKAVKVLYG